MDISIGQSEDRRFNLFSVSKFQDRKSRGEKVKGKQNDLERL